MRNRRPTSSRAGACITTAPSTTTTTPTSPAAPRSGCRSRRARGKPRTESPLRLARGQHDLSLDLAVHHVVERVGGALQRVASAHQRLDLPRAQPRRELPQVRRVAIALPPRELAPENAHDSAALEQRQVERDLRDLARGEADHEIAPLPGHCAYGRLGILSADRIQGDVGGDAQVLEGFAQVLALVVDRDLGAETLAGLQFLVGGGAGDHARTEKLPEL